MDERQEILSHKRWREGRAIREAKVLHPPGHAKKIGTMKTKSSTDYTYLKDLSDDTKYYFAGREYLRDLPVRPKKSQNSRSTEVKPRSEPEASSFSSLFTPYARRINLPRGSAVLPTIVSLAVITITILALRRHRISATTKHRETEQDGKASVSIAGHTPQKKKGKKKKRKSKTTPLKDSYNNLPRKQLFEDAKKPEEDDKCTNHMADQTIVDQTSIHEVCEEVRASVDLNAEENGHSKFDETLQESEALVPLTPSKISILPENQLSSPGLCMTNDSFAQVASGWESRGLDRKKSLEMAAHFEMNLFFLERIKQFLVASSQHIFNRMDIFSSNIQQQLETNHRAIVDLPDVQKLQRYRDELPYSLLNVKVSTRCILLAFVPRLYPWLGYMPSLISWLPNLYLDWNTPTSGYSVISPTSYLTSYVSYWRILVYETIPTVLRLLWPMMCLLLCHRFVSRSLCYAILAINFIPWKDFFLMSIGVLATNIFLTLMMLKKCNTSRLAYDPNRSQYAREMVDYYSQNIVLFQAGAYISAVVMGVYMSKYGHISSIS